MKQFGDEEMKSEMKGIQKCIKPNLQIWKGGESKMKVAQNLKHILVLQFLKSKEHFEIGKFSFSGRKHPDKSLRSSETA